MNSSTQISLAEALRRYHSGDDILLLPCAWDVASARVFETAGSRAVGTTSAGVAATLGFRDCQHLDLDEYLVLVRRIAEAVKIPVSVDFEAGYAPGVEQIVANVRRVLDAGAVGINIEDVDHYRDRRSAAPLVLPEAMVERIRAIRSMSEEYGVPLFINARTDSYWLSDGGTREAMFSEAVDRGNAYAGAGADCVFVPGHLDRDTIAGLASELSCPLNVVVKQGTLPVAELKALGVKRVSLGSGPMRGALGLTRKVAQEFIGSGTYRTFLDIEIPFEEVQQLFEAGD